MALVFSALYRVPGFQLGQVSDLAFGFFCGFGLTHYYLDSKIWRVRSDPGPAAGAAAWVATHCTQTVTVLPAAPSTVTVTGTAPEPATSR